MGDPWAIGVLLGGLKMPREINSSKNIGQNSQKSTKSGKNRKNRLEKKKKKSTFFFDLKLSKKH